MATKTALLVLAEGAEEMEAVIAADVMRRGKIDVTIAGLDKNDIVNCSRNVNIKADKCLADLKDHLFDAIVLPGGGLGAKNLCASSDVGEILRLHHKAGNLIAAICAAPTALAAHGIGKGKKVTSYPSMKSKLGDYSYSEENVVSDGNLLTSRGPGTAFEWALEIVSILQGKATADKLKSDMLIV